MIYSALYSDFAHLEELGPTKVAYTPNDLQEPGILILHGGQDISPSIYKHKVSKYTHAEAKLSHRDEHEVSLAKRAIELGITIFGICRGAQLSCALAGGSLIQHVTNHHSTHGIRFNDGSIIPTTSCHHQMMNPTGTKYELLAVADHNRSSCYIVEEEKDIKVRQEPEIIWFNEIKALAVQGHPEWMKRKDPLVQFCIQFLKDKQ